MGVAAAFGELVFGAPLDVAGLELEACEAVVFIEHVDVAIAVEGLAHEAVELGVGIEELVLFWFWAELEDFGTVPVAGDEEFAVFEDGGMDGDAVFNFEGVFPEDLAVVGVHGHDVFGSPEEELVGVGVVDEDGGAVAGGVGAAFPFDLACVFIEGDECAFGFNAELYDDEVFIDEG